MNDDDDDDEDMILGCGRWTEGMEGDEGLQRPSEYEGHPSRKGAYSYPS